MDGLKTTPKTIAQKLISSTLIVGFSSLFLALGRIGILIFLARYLQPADFGLFAITILAVNLANQITSNTLNQAAQVIPLDQGSIFKPLITLNLKFATVIAGALTIALFSTPLWPHIPTGLRPLLLSIVPIPWLLALRDSLQTVLLRGGLTRNFAQARIYGFLFGYVGGTALGIRFDLGALTLSIALIGQLVFESIILCKPGYAQSEFIASNTPKEKDIIRASKYFLGLVLANASSRLIQRVTITGTLGLSDLGFFDRANSLIIQLRNLLGDISQKALFPIFSQEVNKDALRKLTIRGLFILTPIALATAALSWVLAPYLIPSLLGSKWIPIIAPLQWLSLGLAFQLLSQIISPFLKTTQAIKMITIQSWVINALLAILLFFFTSHGVDTAAMIITALNALQFCCLLPLLRSSTLLRAS